MPWKTEVPVWIGSFQDIWRGLDSKRDGDAIQDGRGRVRVPITQMAESALMTEYLRGFQVPEDHFKYEGQGVHAIALVKPKFKYVNLDVLNLFEQAQREWYARLAGGANNEGHMWFLEVVDILRFDNIMAPPAARGAGTLISDLPDWFATDLLLEIQRKHGSPRWLRETRVLIKTAKQFAALLAHGGTRSLCLCDLGHSRTDIPQRLWSIGWWHRSLLGKIPDIEYLRDNFSEPYLIQTADQDMLHEYKDMKEAGMKRLLGSCRKIASQFALLMRTQQQGASAVQAMGMREFHSMVSCLQCHVDSLDAHRFCGRTVTKYPPLLLL